MSTCTEAAWHYTTGASAQAIIFDGCIKPATAFVPIHERPVVLFTRSKRWEPTASNWLVDAKTGLPRTATLQEMEVLAGGLYRFGVDAKDLLSWRDLMDAARISKSDAKALVRTGRQAGSRPALWMGRVTAVPLTQVFVLQRWIAGTWISDPSELCDDSRVARINSSEHQCCRA